MRKLKRSVARHNMIKAGITQMNKHPLIRDQNGMLVRADSYFSQNWRDYVVVK